MTRQIFIMTYQISHSFSFCLVIHFLILYLLFFVLYSKLKICYSLVNLILAKFSRNTCLKFTMLFCPVTQHLVLIFSMILPFYTFIEKSFTDLPEPRILESLAGCRTFLFAVFCKIGQLECKVQLIFDFMSN